MNRTEWNEVIKQACIDAGTYRPFFDSVIGTLSGILEHRDEVDERYKAFGGEPVTQHTNKAKETNTVKNPLLVLLNDLNTQALAYWRDLGLTPAGYKKLNAEIIEDKKQDKLSQFFEKILDE